jgi:hypothetical protein
MALQTTLNLCQLGKINKPSTNAQPSKTQKEGENLVTQILIEFDPKQTSPLEVINALNEMMQKHYEENKVKEYALAVVWIENNIITSEEILEIQPPSKEETPPKEETQK